MLTPDKWKQVKDLFSQAAEIENPAERRAFLASLADETVRGEVLELLAADDSAGDFFENVSIISGEAVSSEAAATAASGKKIGNYRIIREIGRGGMGTVYLAERADLKRKVALKIIRRGIDSEVISRRFRREQDILAALEHPNIARLLDGGVTTDGTPYFVMEYVEGENLTDYCRSRELPLIERIIIFRKVCAAVAYAHSRLVVHRDLKPSNIVVNEDGEPKLLDFGISKLLVASGENPATSNTTAAIGMMMTPNYASPEQFRSTSAIAVSTATDIYSLGIILYELLTGFLPYDVTNRSLEEIIKIVCEDNPPIPSEIVQDSRLKAQDLKGESRSLKLENEGSNIKDQRPKTQDQNPKLLRGDLDNIILKALRKEPARRYSTVEKFSDDLRRHLEGLPVTARADTFAYRTEKFIRRNRTAVIAAGIVLVTLIAGITGTSWQAVRAERARRLSEKRFEQVRALANHVVFKYDDEIAKLPGATKAREMLIADALTYLDALTQDAAENGDVNRQADATLRKELALAYLRIGKVQGKLYDPNLGQNEAATASNRKAVELLEPLAAEINTADAQTLSALASAYIELGSNLRRQGDHQGAAGFFEKAVNINEKNIKLNPDSVDQQLSFAQNLIYYGDLSPDVADNEGYTKALEISENVWRQNPDNLKVPYFLCGTTGRIADGLMLQAKVAHEVEDYDREQRLFKQAAPLYRRSSEVAEKIYAAAPNNAINQTVLTVAHFNESELQTQLGQFSEALKTQQAALGEYQRIVTADPENQEAKQYLAEMRRALGITYGKMSGQSADGAAKAVAQSAEHFRAALSLLDEVIDKQPDNFEFRRKRFDFAVLSADLLLERGSVAEAREIYEKAYVNLEAAVNDKNKLLVESLRAIYLEKLGNCELASVNQLNAAAQRRAALDQTVLNYQKAIEILQAKTQTAAGQERDAANQSVDTATAARIEFLRRKINHCQELRGEAM